MEYRGQSPRFVNGFVMHDQRLKGPKVWDYFAQPLALAGSRRNRRAESHWPDESDPSLPSELT